jgi:hypothetical protein
MEELVAVLTDILEELRDLNVKMDVMNTTLNNIDTQTYGIELNTNL